MSRWSTKTLPKGLGKVTGHTDWRAYSSSQRAWTTKILTAWSRGSREEEVIRQQNIFEYLAPANRAGGYCASSSGKGVPSKATMRTVTHNSSLMAAQRRKVKIDAAERSGIAKGIPWGTLPSSLLSGVRIRARHGTSLDYALPLQKMTNPTMRVGHWHRTLHSPQALWEDPHHSKEGSKQIPVLAEKIKQKRRK